MKQLIFTLTLLPFLAAYPAGNSAAANASACAADVKATDADSRSARDEKAQSADQQSEIHCLEQQLLPGIHYLFSQARGIERKLMERTASLLDSITDSKPIEDKYNDVLTVFECPRPLWAIISRYAAVRKSLKIETALSALVPEAEHSRINSLAEKIKDLAKEHAFMELLRAFHDANETFDQCWPYSRTLLDSFLQRGYIYKPINLDLTILEHSGRAEHLNRIPPWGRPFIDPDYKHQRNADLRVEVLHFVERHHSVRQENESRKPEINSAREIRRRMLQARGLEDDADSKPCPEEPPSVIQSSTAWQNTSEVISLAYSWDKILKWLITLPAEQQKAFADRIKSTRTYESLTEYEAALARVDVFKQ